ncbi:MAG: DUF3006 domain-containing protein [Ruminococcus sp.]|nr:DUF3006 domain-containing protein [Ruminococcus sp.]
MTVDRIENEIVIVETETGYMKIPLSEFDGNVREGDIIVNINGRYKADKEMTEKRRKEISEKLSKLWER